MGCVKSARCTLCKKKSACGQLSHAFQKVPSCSPLLRPLRSFFPKSLPFAVCTLDELEGRGWPRPTILLSRAACLTHSLTHPARPPSVPQLNLPRAPQGARDRGVVCGDGGHGADGPLLADRDGLDAGVAAGPATPHALELVMVPEAANEPLPQPDWVDCECDLGSFAKSSLTSFQH